jgi:outer membrane protein, heavy metal efflux system
MNTIIKNTICLGLLILINWQTTVYADEKTAIDNKLQINEEQLIALFYQRNLDLIAANFNVDTSKAQELIAAAIPNPVFSFSLSSLNPAIFDRQNSNQPLPAVSPQIQQLIETAGKRRLRIESSELATEAVNFDLLDTARVLTNAVRRSFYGLLLAQKNLQVANDNYERYQKIQKLNRTRLAVGDIAETDFARIEVESLKAQADQDRAQTTLTQARADLLSLLAWPEKSINLEAVDAWPQAALNITKSSQEQLLDNALSQRPDLQAAKIRIEQAGKLLTLAHRLAIPDVTVGAFYQRDPGNYFANSGGISVSVPIPLFYKQEGEISQARVSLNNAELTLTQTEQKIKAELVKALSAWQSADAIATRFEQSVVKRIEALREAQEFAYQNGAIGLLDLLDAERNYKAMMSDYYTALANRSNAWADLLMAYGEEVK